MASIYNRGTRQRPRWWAKIKVGTEWRAFSTKQPTKEAALREADRMQDRADRGLPVGEVVAKPGMPSSILTIEDLAAKFLKEYHRGKIKSMDRYRAAVRRDLDGMVLPHLGKLQVTAVRRAQVIAWVQTLQREGYTPHSVNRALARVSAIYTWAETMEIVDCRNPIARFERLHAPPADEHFTMADVHKLLRLEDDLPPLVWAAIYTGMRKGELFGLTWARIRFDLGAIEVKTSYDTGSTKTGKARVVPIHPELLLVLKSWQEKCPTPEGLVFPVRHQDRRRRQLGWRMGNQNDMAGLAKVLKAAKVDIPKLHPWHVFRHTWATLAIEAGMARDAVEMILGHRSGGSATTSGYLHSDLPYLTRELAKLTLTPPPPADIASLDQRRAALARG